MSEVTTKTDSKTYPLRDNANKGEYKRQERQEKKGDGDDGSCDKYSLNGVKEECKQGKDHRP